MRRGRIAKLSMAVAIAAVVLSVPAVMYGASAKAAQARTAFFLDEGVGGANPGWQSILMVLNPNPVSVGVKVTWYGAASLSPHTCGLGFGSTNKLTACGPLTLAPNQNFRFDSIAVLPAAAFLYFGHIKVATNDRTQKVVLDGWIYYPGRIDGTAHVFAGRDGAPSMRGGFHQEYVVDDDLWVVPDQTPELGS